MKKNIRVPVSSIQDLRGDGQIPLFYPVALSFVCHAVFLLLFVVTPSLRSEKPQTRSVIDVSMVSLKNPATDAAKKSVVENKAPKIEKPEAVEKPSVPPPIKKVVSVADTPPKPKTSLKKKTFKSTQVVKQAIEQLEKQLDDQTRVKTETAPPEPLESALERLRQEVGKLRPTGQRHPLKTRTVQPQKLAASLAGSTKAGKRRPS
jgi:outer membrane biosynthesis protein TonB